MTTIPAAAPPVETGTSVPVLEIRNLAKTFGGVQALKGVDLTIRSGEIHGLLGQNGSGKSTLIKVLAGFHEPDAGASLAIGGQDVSLPLSPGDFQALGMRFVHQDLGLIPALTVLENLRVAAWADAVDLRISWREERRRARELFDRFGLNLDPNTPVFRLRPVERALLAIVRAVSSMPEGDAAMRSLLVLDEPTVFLPQDDTELLFSLTRRIAASGAGVLFVSHDLDEVLELTDRVTVFRDGRAVGTTDTPSATTGTLVELIVGHALAETELTHTVFDRDVPPSVIISGAQGGLVNSADLELRAGEVVGVTGLSGAGFEDLSYLLFGIGLATGGTLSIDGQTAPLSSLTPSKALDMGVALVPADRQRDGAILSLSVLDNASMQVLGNASVGPHLKRKRLQEMTREALREFDVRPADPNLPAGSLSGGNQQKVLMAKWLQTQPRLLIVHEPTQGVDVGAREEIFRLLRQAAANGTAVLCASSDHEQLALLCDRVSVLRQGVIAAELVGSAATKQAISQTCYQSSPISEPS